MYKSYKEITEKNGELCYSLSIFLSSKEAQIDEMILEKTMMSCRMLYLDHNNFQTKRELNNIIVEGKNNKGADDLIQSAHYGRQLYKGKIKNYLRSIGK